MKYVLSLSVLLLLGLTSCKKDPPPDPLPPDPVEPGGILGFSVMGRLPGIWNGPVTSTTALGGYAEWIVDMRPVSANQVSSKNELDELNDIHLSFFVGKYGGQTRLFFRNGGGFAGQKRVSYFRADSVEENGSQAYYRFVELIKGKSRAYTEVIFRADSLYLRTYTNKYNQLAQPTLHMTWSAKRQDVTAAESAVTQFQFPQETVANDFGTFFDGQTEAVYFSTNSDPYPESGQPYLGRSTVQFSFAPGFSVDNNKKVFLIITTQPLINGFTWNQANMKYRSRYVRIGAGTGQFEFNYMHPGSYYVYALYDADGNNALGSGDYVSTQNVAFTLGALGTVSAQVQMNYVIP